MNTNQLIKLADFFYKLSSAGAYRNPKLPPQFWDKFDEMCVRLKVNPKELAPVIQSESGFDSKAVNFVFDKTTGKPKLRIDPATGKHFMDRFNGKIPQAKGLNQLIWSTAKGLGMTPQIWDTYDLMPAEEQLVWVEKYFTQNSIAGKTRGAIYETNFGSGFKAKQNGIMYASQEYMSAHPEINWQNPTYQANAYIQNKALDRAKKGYIVAEDLHASIGVKPTPPSQPIAATTSSSPSTTTTAPTTSPVPATQPVVAVK